jgi:hypothetical protein
VPAFRREAIDAPIEARGIEVLAGMRRDARVERPGAGNPFRWEALDRADVQVLLAGAGQRLPLEGNGALPSGGVADGCWLSRNGGYRRLFHDYGRLFDKGRGRVDRGDLAIASTVTTKSRQDKGEEEKEAEGDENLLVQHNEPDDLKSA